MFILAGNIITSVFWGVLISSILTGLLFYLPKAINVRYRFSVPYLLLLSVMFLFFLFQGSMLVGAVKFKKGVNTIEQRIETVHSEAGIHELGCDVRHEITLYIWRRTGWMAGGILIATLLLARDANRTNRRNTPVRRRYDHLVY